MKRTFDLIIAFGILVLFIIRCCFDETEWIVIIQYLGMIIAYADFFVETHKKLSERLLYKYLYLALFIVALVLVAISLIAITIRVKWMVGAKALDLVTLTTLFLSLPKRFFIELLGVITEEKDE